MRGKKIDTEFLSQFILECASQGQFSSEEIINLAKSKITEIDIKIQEVEKLKILRSKLLDVICSFDKPLKKDTELDKKILSFYDIQNMHISKHICDLLKNSNSIKISLIDNKKFKDTDIAWCIKQMISFKIVYKLHDLLMKGQQYENYLNFVMKEGQFAVD